MGYNYISFHVHMYVLVSPHTWVIDTYYIYVYTVDHEDDAPGSTQVSVSCYIHTYSTMPKLGYN